MPVRILRPTLRQSERWNRCTFFEQSFYIRLITIADDYGRYEAHPALLASECFPYGDDGGLPVLAHQIDGMLRSLATKDLLYVYESEGKHYFQLTRWKERIRLEKGSRYPDPSKCKIVWKCQSDDWQMSDRCLSDVGNPENTQIPETGGLSKNDRQMPVIREQMTASPPTPTPAPATAPTPSTTAVKCVRVNLNQILPDKKAVLLGNGVEDLIGRLNGLYHRSPNDPWTYEEQHLCCEISKRPNWDSEWKDLMEYRYRLVAKRFFPQSILALLTSWTAQVDKSRTSKKNPSLFAGSKKV